MFNTDGLFLLSFTCLLIGVFHIAHILYFRKNGKTIFYDYDRKSTEYKKAEKIASNFGITIAIAITLLIAVMVAFTVRSIILTESLRSALDILIIGPIIILVCIAATIYISIPLLTKKK